MKTLFINILKTIALPFLVTFMFIFFIFEIFAEAFDNGINLFKKYDLF